ncbi:hypothetical protein METBIDRAFT_40609 [Metschnikowia bicuspidata var. bicuspidata NRRL YB-4993]|uniref:YCII-related domain-containing protein n=1 Tax=Metschnikowia bicuspidata var. bicuspidata NRRL YB-4993 TaxID=869754 RepID=A0A1A0HDV9_9ASCO|nr:hypothetical protein METBIDRAFT_40609 [Metschnikowia bicuspidata var. bicuspidata NRRL YB-4993]OBA22279.1 hypothetical protein METBIDRAFT_40609 [Metschnikowia bicuspidata var. bicuspidata NRRL YB-4993]
MKVPKKLEWLVIIYDKPVNKRLAFRSDHLAKVPEKVKCGVISSCGPIFKDESKLEFIGSSFTIQAETKSEVLEFLKLDVYAEKGVWDFSNVVIHPYQPFYRSAKELPQ